MSWLLHLIIISAWVTAQLIVAPSGSAWSTGVPEIPPSDLDVYLSKAPQVLVLFYVTWCPWCRRLLPVWKKLNGFVRDKIACVQVRMDRASHSIQDKYDVRAYPKLTWFSGKKNATFDQSRLDFHTLVQWLYEVSDRGPLITVNSRSELDALLEGCTSHTVAIWWEVGRQTRVPELKALSSMLSRDMLFIKSGSDEVLDYVRGRLAHTPEALAKMQNLISSRQTVLALLHPFGNDPGAIAEAKSAGEVSGSDSASFLDEEAPLEHFPYSDSHIDYSAQLWDPRIELTEFLQTYMFPVITEWNADSASRILEVGRPFMVAVIPSKVPESILEDLLDGISSNTLATTPYNLTLIEHVLWVIGQRHRRDMVTVYSGSQTLPERRLLQLLGADPASYEPTLAYVTLNPTGTGIHAPALKYLAPSEVVDKVFQMKNELGGDPEALVGQIEGWLADIRSNKIHPSIRSEEPLGAQNNPGPVYHLTALEFQSEVLEARNVNYLVDFYAPWCGHCRVLAPVYEQAALAFRQAGYHNVKFGKLDATANEVLGVPIHGYPTLILYPAGANKTRMSIMPMTPHTAPQIISFVARHAGTQISEAAVLQQLGRLHMPDMPVLADEL